MAYALSGEGRQQLDQLLVRTAQAFNSQVGKQFSATPSGAQTIMQKIVEQGDSFLKMINVLPVSDMKGDKILLGLTGRVASRTNTATPGNKRSAKRLANTDAQGYELFDTNFDVALAYNTIDVWSKFPNFAELYMKAVREAIQNDILQAGWTGTSAEANTDIVTNPLLQDLNKGWFQLLRTYNGGSQHVAGTELAPIQLGGFDFPTLDSLVHDAKQRIAPQFRQRPDLVALIADDLLADQDATYYESQGNTPTEKALLRDTKITRAFGGLPTISPAFMPNGSVLVTPLANLSVYYQSTSVRRTQRDNPEQSQVEEFNSMNMGYVVEEELAASFVENVTLVE
ncbi:phage major capsid protein, P2 family [Methylobacter sp. Wu8]|uniref:phage major capsid protein, P2 family n=1 Tax=Methylobacter sp. Wu8 TaxID=3118457 RepID=UPI002F2C324F